MVCERKTPDLKPYVSVCILPDLVKTSLLYFYSNLATRVFVIFLYWSSGINFFQIAMWHPSFAVLEFNCAKLHDNEP